ncbi:MAG: PLP-dependent transferase [Bacteroidia bacterium]|nr:PLP-dependent transferase [Bacteroidia bacterium]
MDISFILNELGEERPRHYGAVTPPLYQNSNFCFASIQDMREALVSELDNPFYTRGNNPTVEVLRKKIAALEGAEDALIFASGSAAIAAAVMSCVQGGDHVVCVAKPYSWTAKLLGKMLSRYGVESSFIDGRETENWERAIRPNTRLFMLESPNSMTFELQDIPAVTAIAKAHGIHTILDNSYASPLNQNPLAMGVDIVCHSASKYLSGHSDMVAGVLASSRSRVEKIFDSEFMTLGGIISPHDAWLMIRGLRTLAIRMERVAQTTPVIVDFLANHPKVEQVIYPHHPSFPQYELAQKQQKAPSGQFTVLLKAEKIEQVEAFCDALQRFLIACSWGGYESLIYPVCVLYSSGNYSETPLPWNMVRFYIGLEEKEVLLADLEQALEKL